MGYVENLLSANERILLRRRQHWYGLLRPVLSEVIGLAFALAVVWLAFSPAVWRAWLGWLPRGMVAELRPALDIWVRFAPPWLMLVLIALLLISAAWNLSRRALLWLTTRISHQPAHHTGAAC
jgi:hypothetical protein